MNDKAARGEPVQAFAALKAAKPPATVRGRQRQAILQAEAGKIRARRDRIFKHEWAKARLCSILGLARADQWNGYVPPSTQPADKDGRVHLSRSPHRKLLVELIQDVQRFEETGELPEYAIEQPGDV